VAATIRHPKVGRKRERAVLLPCDTRARLAEILAGGTRDPIRREQDF
jgi:hypothetical protein